MIKNKYKKIILISFCIVFIITSVLTSIIAMDVYHLKHCYIPECTICKIVNVSVNFIKVIKIMIYFILIELINYFIIQVINQIIIKQKRKTLVELNVIQLK